MDRVIPNNELKKKKRKKVIQFAGIALLIIIVFASFNYVINVPIERSKITTAISKVGAIESSLNASAIVLPEFEEVISSPIQGDILKVNIPVGEQVKAGASILLLNTEYIQLEYNRKQNQLALSEIQLKRKKLELEKKISDLKNAFKVKELEVKNLNTTVNSAQKLFDVGGGTQEELDLAALNFKIGKLELEQIKKEISYAEKSKINEIEELQLNIIIQKKNVDEVRRKIEKSAIKSTQDGVVTWVNEEIGSNINPGDILAKVANLSSYKVEGTISDVYGSKISVGQKVIVRINKTDLAGKIKSIYPSVKDGIVTFSIQLQQNNHPLLQAQKKAEAFVIKKSNQNTIILPNGAAFKGFKKQKLFVINNGTAYAREVTTGLSNRDFIEIVSGINEGEEVITSNMEEHENRDKIRIN